MHMGVNFSSALPVSCLYHKLGIIMDILNIVLGIMGVVCFGYPLNQLCKAILI